MRACVWIVIHFDGRSSIIKYVQINYYIRLILHIYFCTISHADEVEWAFLNWIASSHTFEYNICISTSVSNRGWCKMMVNFERTMVSDIYPKRKKNEYAEMACLCASVWVCVCLFARKYLLDGKAYKANANEAIKNIRQSMGKCKMFLRHFSNERSRRSERRRTEKKKKKKYCVYELHIELLVIRVAKNTQSQHFTVIIIHQIVLHIIVCFFGNAFAYGIQFHNCNHFNIHAVCLCTMYT